MAKKPKAVGGDNEVDLEIKGRLRKLKIKNFRAIGSVPVEIELDDIVVLVGPNNAGKSSILRAYEIVMLDGSKEGHLKLEDFPNSVLKEDELPEIELETEVVEGEPGAQWIQKIDGKNVVRERWVWQGPGAGKRTGWNVNTSQWDDKVPWGAANVANSRRPQPHVVRAFDSPETQADQINELLKTAVLNEAKKIQGDDGANLYEKLLADVKAFQEKAVVGAAIKIDDIEKRLNDIVAAIFLDHEVEFLQSAETTSKSLNLFPGASRLLLGPRDGHKSGLEYQGSGTRRTLLWAALKILSEEKAASTRPHVLLIDEPELCLHPNAIRDACNVLYGLAERPGWQVMVTTHSPVFIDLSRKNTSIVRVERTGAGDIKGTTLFRPERAKLSDSDQELLKLLNVYDPYVAEFFFGGRIIVVEGDTEYSAFKHISKITNEFKDLHVIRARGKPTICALVKILNHFGASYAVLHDADTPRTTRRQKDGTRKEIANPAWTSNEKIRLAVKEAPINTKIRLVASVYNFEAAYFGELAAKEKPYGAIENIKEDQEKFDTVKSLLAALVDHNLALPVGAMDWSDVAVLEAAVNAALAPVQGA